MKADDQKEYWTRLTKEAAKNANIAIDWAKYVDEDDEGEEQMKGIGNDWDPNNMNGDLK